VSEGGLVPLSFMSGGQSGILEEIRGQRHHFAGGVVDKHAGPAKQYRRAHKDHQDRSHMGLVAGARVRVIKNSSTGPVIVAVGDTRIGLARGVAMKIIIRIDPDAGTEAAGG
jgi:Fe2+ transport system protein FeoA